MVARVAFAPVDTNASASPASAAGVEKRRQEIREQVEQKCRDIQRQAEDAVMALEQELQVQLMKIPRKVRGMSFKEFREEFNGDIQAVLLGGKDSAIAHLLGTAPPATAPRTAGRAGAYRTVAPEPPSTSRGTRKRGAVPAEDPQSASGRPKRGRAAAAEVQTPAPSSSSTPATGGLAPGTAARQAAPGEVVYSQSGSPLTLPPTVMQGGAYSRLPARVAAAAPPGTAGPTLSLTTISRARTAARTNPANVATGRKARGRAKARQAVQEAQAAAAAEADAEVVEVAHGLTITTDDGQQISLDGGLAHLPPELQAAAAKQLQSLKGLVDGLLSQTAPAAAPPAADDGMAAAAAAPAEEAPATAAIPAREGFRRADASEVQKGKCVVLIAGADAEERFTQPLPGREGVAFHVAKVSSRSGDALKLAYYATDGHKWTEVRGAGRNLALRERDAADMGDLVAVFDGLTKRERTLPPEVMDAVQASMA
eukprot:jgi/Tetstr1/438622/TSEL_027173.t1